MTLRQAKLALYHRDAQIAFEEQQLGNQVSPIISNNPELITIYTAVKQYGPSAGAKAMLNAEKKAAELAINSGMYGVFRCIDPLKSMKNQGIDDVECARIGPMSRCFCGHLYKYHHFTSKRDIAPTCDKCPCRAFKFVPTRPEEAGEWWLPRRKNFEVKKWRAKCKCQHAHDMHDPNSHRCLQCGCGHYTSAWLCVSCDRHWEQHETIFETEQERRAAGKAVGEDFMPLQQIPELQDLVFNEKYDKDRNWELNPLPTQVNRRSLPQSHRNQRHVQVEEIIDDEKAHHEEYGSGPMPKRQLARRVPPREQQERRALGGGMRPMAKVGARREGAPPMATSSSVPSSSSPDSYVYGGRGSIFGDDVDEEVILRGEGLGRHRPGPVVSDALAKRRALMARYRARR